MQEKKNIRLIVLLALLITATVVISWRSIQPDITINKNLFKVDDIKQIDKVVLESTNGKVELKFNGARWKINGKYEADRNLIDVLFATIQQAEPKRPVASSLKDSLNHTLEKDGTKVSLFIGNQIQETFFAGGNPMKTQAYFKRAGDEIPYIMIIPGYRVYTSGIFELNENGWRDKRVFNFDWRSFKNLTATFPSTPDKNFKVTIKDRNVGIEGLNVVDTTKLNNYLDAVSLLTADQFLERSSFKDYDSLLQATPEVILNVSDIAGRQYQLSVYNSAKKQTVPGKIDADQLINFDRRRLTEIFWKKDYFIKHQ